MKKKKWTLRRISVMLIVVAIVAVLGIFQQRSQSQNLINSSQTTTIQKGEISLVSIATGKLSSSDEDTLKIVGSVSSLFVKLGDTVSKGDVLGEYAKTATVAQDLYSPVSGIVTKVPSALDNSFEISNANTLAMDVEVSERNINKVVMNQYAEVYVESIDTTFYGQVVSKSTTANALGNYTLGLELTNTSSSVLVGMSGVAKLNIAGVGDYYYHGKVSFGAPRTLDVEGTMISTDVELGQSIKAKQKLGSYQARTASTQIIASKDGVVSKLPGATSTDLIISNPKALQLVVNISETDIHKLEVGQAASLYVEAVDQTFEGTVVEIAQIGNTALDYTTYPVTISFDGKDSPLFIGMSGSATIVVESKSDILVVPYEALVSEGTQRYVISAEWLKNSSKPQSDYYVPVTTGIADVYSVEVSGSNLEGLEIVIPETSTGLGFFARP